MTPYLQALFEYVGEVVNSEDYKWVRTFSMEKQNFMKPDFFVALRGHLIVLSYTTIVPTNNLKYSLVIQA
jgi:hypothetical protein